MSVATDGGKTVLISAEGFAERRRELDSLRNEARREVAERLREARHDGDIEDNPALQDLLAEQAQLERRIAVLEAQLAAARIVEPAADGRAGIGSIVRVREGDGTTLEYELVGTLESDAGNGRVSIAAPVGQALSGQPAGARVEVATPLGPRALEILSVRTAGRPAKEAA